MTITEEEKAWGARTGRFLKAELKRAGVTYSELATRMRVLGFDETEASITNKLARGTLPAAFFIVRTHRAAGAAPVPCFMQACFFVNLRPVRNLFLIGVSINQETCTGFNIPSSSRFPPVVAYRRIVVRRI